EAGRAPERARPLQALAYRGPRGPHALSLGRELLRLAVGPVAAHEPVVRRADDLGAGLERDLNDRVVATDEPRRAQRLDAHVAVGIDREDLGTQALVRHLDELREGLLLAVIELHLCLTREAAKVSLALHERVPGGKVLRETDERVVDRHVAMRVVFRHHHADDIRRLAEWPIVAQPLLEHRVEDPALYRF